MKALIDNIAVLTAVLIGLIAVVVAAGFTVTVHPIPAMLTIVAVAVVLAAIPSKADVQ